MSSVLGATRNVTFWILCLGVALVSWRFMVGDVEATMGFVAYHAVLRPIGFYAHVVFAPVALALVPFQLWQGLRQNRPGMHRLLGRLYGPAIVISGLGGLWLAATTTAGQVASIGFASLAIVWLATTLWGISLAMRGDRINHRRWMIRSIALTFSAVTLRLQLPIGMALDIPFDTAYPVIAWLCWVPNLVVAEMIVRWPRRPLVRLRAA